MNSRLGTSTCGGRHELEVASDMPWKVGRLSLLALFFFPFVVATMIIVTLVGSSIGVGGRTGPSGEL